ncbi:hypothetical protein [Azospirillum doebereinerae]
MVPACDGGEGRTGRCAAARLSRDIALRAIAAKPGPLPVAACRTSDGDETMAGHDVPYPCRIRLLRPVHLGGQLLEMALPDRARDQDGQGARSPEPVRWGEPRTRT